MDDEARRYPPWNISECKVLIIIKASVGRIGEMRFRRRWITGLTVSNSFPHAQLKMNWVSMIIPYWEAGAGTCFCLENRPKCRLYWIWYVHWQCWDSDWYATNIPLGITDSHDQINLILEKAIDLVSSSWGTWFKGIVDFSSSSAWNFKNPCSGPSWKWVLDLREVRISLSGFIGSKWSPYSCLWDLYAHQNLRKA